MTETQASLFWLCSMIVAFFLAFVAGWHLGRVHELQRKIAARKKLIEEGFTQEESERIAELEQAIRNRAASKEGVS